MQDKPTRKESSKHALSDSLRMFLATVVNSKGRQCTQRYTETGLWGLRALSVLECHLVHGRG